MKKVYDFELEQVLPWSIKTERQCQASVSHISTRRKEYFLNDAFSKLDKENFPENKDCEICKKAKVPYGNKRFCHVCLLMTNTYTDDALIFDL